MGYPMHLERHQKKCFPKPWETGHFSSFSHIFQPVLPKNSGSPIHSKELFEHRKYRDLKKTNFIIV